MIRRIPASDARPLRQRVLRPHQTLDEVGFPGDDGPDSVHFGAFAGDVLVGIASLLRQPPEGSDAPTAWRVRGMATAPEVRGGGYGGKLLEACLEQARAQGGTFVWCNARTGVADFYRRYGFRAEGGVFEIPGIGPHVLMSRALR